MSLRGFCTRTLLGFAITGACALTVPALASAADSMSVTPCNSGCTPNNATLKPGGASSYTITTNIDQSLGTPTGIKIQLAPGALINLSGGDSACIFDSSDGDSSSCVIGSGSVVTTNFGPLPVDVYLVAPTASADAAGVDLECTSSCPGVLGTSNFTVSHSELAIHQLTSGPATGNLVGVLTTDLSSNSEAANITSISLNLNGKVDNAAATRMPTACPPAINSKLTITGGTHSHENASPDFGNALTGCSALPFTPSLTGSATVTGPLSGGKFAVSQTTMFSQPAGQSASKTTTISIPASVLTPNPAVLSLVNTSTPVGTASTTSALLPAGFNTLTGKVFLTKASSSAPLTLKIKINSIASLAFELDGTVNTATNSFVFSHLPDVPLSSLTVNFTGGPKGLFETTCKTKSGALKAPYTGFNGKSWTSNSTLKVSGCPGPPTVTNGSLSGLASGSPVLKFKVNHGSHAPALKSFTFGLGNGLSLTKSATKNQGLAVTGCGKFKAALNSGKLTITLSKPAASCSVKLSKPAIKESASLEKQAKKGKKIHFSFPFTIKDKTGKTTSTTLNISAK